MANLTDNPSYYPPSVYRLDSNDAVQGWTIAGGLGIANFSAQNLADRTAYLKSHVDALEADSAKLVRANNLSDLTNISQARSNLDLGSAALRGDSYFQQALGFSPVQQGGGTGQGTSKVYIGWAPAGKLKLQVDLTDLGNMALESWVIALGYEAAINNALTKANTAQTTANYANLPAGTRLPFAQSSAPPGWTQVNDDSTSNRMLRVVNGGGAGTGGTHNPVINSVVVSHTHGFITGGNNVDHTHAVNDPGHKHTWLRGTGGDGGDGGIGRNVAASYGSDTSSSATGIWLNGASASHNHSGSTDGGSSGTSWQPRFLDLIVCAKN